MDAGRDEDALVRRRQHRGMDGACDGRTGVIYSSTIRQARCAEIERNIEATGRLKPIAVQTHDHFGHTAQPTKATANGRDLSRGQIRAEGRSNPVGSGIAASGGTNVQTVGGPISTGSIESGLNVSAGGKPTAEAGFKG